jgi:hypothetical protein
MPTRTTPLGEVQQEIYEGRLSCIGMCAVLELLAGSDDGMLVGGTYSRSPPVGTPSYVQAIYRPVRD